jgi:hypothetical protein
LSRTTPPKFAAIDGTARLPTLGRTSETLANTEDAAVHKARRSRERTPSGVVMGRLVGLASAKSLFSILRVWSVGSILSVGSVLSIGSAGSILSIGSAGSILSIGGAGSSPRTDSDEPGEEEERSAAVTCEAREEAR